LAEELEEAFGIKAKLVGSSGGAFEITVDGKLIFSKLKSGHFPEEEEIVRMLKG
jgi:selT/selW/selH-like putative selenoprotein